MVVRISEALVLVVAPMCVGLAMVAPDFVPLVLGEQWRTMIVPLQVLSAYAAVTILLVVPNQVLLVTGQERFGTRYAFAQLVVMPIAFVLGSRWGIVGLALAWPIVHPFLALVLIRKVLSELNLPWMEFVRQVLWPAGSACTLMAVGVWATRLAMPHRPTYATLSGEIVLGAAIYAASLYVLHRRRLLDTLGVVRSLRAKPEA
jgi:O-antigen/teichoic acid export membrane protein